MFYKAGQLDARNIGSNVTIQQADGIIYGSIATIEQKATTTEIFLAHGEEPIILGRTDQVDVVLGTEANYAFYTSRAMERLEALLKDPQAPAIQAARSSAPLLKAV